MSDGRALARAAVIIGSMAACAAAPVRNDPPAPVRSDPPAPARNGSTESAPDALPPETKQRLIEAAIIDALRDELYFSDRIRERLDRTASLRVQVDRAARELRLHPKATIDALVRADAPAGRESLRSLLPEHDDAEAIRRRVQAELRRIAAPLESETRPGAQATARTIDAAERLLVEQMRIPGDRAIWGKVDDELDRKIRVLVASRAPRSDRLVWCELAAWTLLAKGLNDRAVGVAEESSRWLANAGRPASPDFVVASLLAQRSPGTLDDVRSIAERRKSVIDADPDLRARLDRALKP